MNWKDIKACVEYMYDSERYVIGFLTKNNTVIDVWNNYISQDYLNNIGYGIVRYKTGYYLMPFYKGNPIINTDIPFIRDNRSYVVDYINNVIAQGSRCWTTEYTKSAFNYIDLYNNLQYTGIIQIDEMKTAQYIGSARYHDTVPQTNTQPTENGQQMNALANTQVNTQVNTQTGMQAASFGVAESTTKNSEEVLNPWDPEKVEIKDVTDILRPFEGDAFNPDDEDIDKHLLIPRDAKPQFNRALLVFNSISTMYGLPLSKSRIMNLYDELSSKLQIIDQRLKDIFDVPNNIDYSGRTEHNNHIGVLYCDYCEKYINKAEHVKSGKVSFTLEHLKKYHKMFSNMESTPEIEDIIAITEDIYDYKINSSRLSQLKDFRGVVLDRYPTKMCSDIWATKDENDPDIYWVHPHIRLADTNRFQCYSPNPQGKNPEVKSCITAPKGYKIISLDISAQDVYCLVWGIMKDKGLKKNVISLGDPYMALLNYCGYETTPINKKAIKRPLLSRMNGKQIKVILDESEHPELNGMIKDTLLKIEREKGYSEIVDKSENESYSNKPKRSGLFGTEKYISTYGSTRSKIARQVLNANFQMTSAEILCLSYMSMMHDLMNDKIKGITLDDFCPLIPIHDEIVAICKEDKVDVCKRLLSYYILPQIEGWGRMSGDITVGQHYEHK